MDSAGAGPLRQAVERFGAFFRELGEAFVEREDVLKQIALALLSRQHVLMTGPPGTAKSQLAHAVVGRIVSKETGRSSLFSRQFTESTVQTDLVGPIDFKTLMETGRTEHFTDEGILGAVHAFLDEIFDGRDMLLRSTLNLLQERELKQGTKVATGKIECALMTSNRYLVEILDNERLLAFVDRIAFLCFVPKGFAGPEALEKVLHAQLAGRKPPALEARLTIEDLDVLQAAVDDVYLAEPICDSLAALVRSFDTELAAARRADPGFIPSRYLSTRTIVRVGSLLRAICFLDWMLGDPARPLEVRPADLADLRLGLTLSGPSPAQTAQLLHTQTDPRERRQLGIVRTEREIFDRCLAALPRAEAAPKPREVSAALLESAAPASLGQLASGRLLELSRALALAATSGQRGADHARQCLEAALHEIAERALRSGLWAGSADNADPVGIATGLAQLANDVEQTGRTHVRAARWLRARALDVIDQTLRLGWAPMGEAMVRLLAPSHDLTSLQDHLEAALGRLERLGDVRTGLRHAGADEEDAAARDSLWRETVERASASLLPVLRDGLAAAGASLLAAAAGSRGDLGAELRALRPAFALAGLATDRLQRLGADGAALYTVIVAPLLTPVARAAYQRVSGANREALAGALEKPTAALAAAGLLKMLAPGDIIAWSAEALLRGAEPDLGVGARPRLDVAGYRNLRRTMPRATLASLILDLYLRVAPARTEDLLEPDAAVKRVSELCGRLSAETRAALIRRDVAYLEAPIAYFERWFGEIAGSLPADPRGALQALVQARFFELTHDEAVLARFAMEARLMAMVFAPGPFEPLLDRLAALEGQSTTLAQQLLVARAGQLGQPDEKAPESPPPTKPGRSARARAAS